MLEVLAVGLVVVDGLGVGWRARLGFLIAPGNPSVEPELIALAPSGVSAHFSRMVAGGPAGTHHGRSFATLANPRARLPVECWLPLYRFAADLLPDRQRVNAEPRARPCWSGQGQTRGA